jgi:hypothetical protein
MLGVRGGLRKLHPSTQYALPWMHHATNPLLTGPQILGHCRGRRGTRLGPERTTRSPRPASAHHCPPAFNRRRDGKASTTARDIKR